MDIGSAIKKARIRKKMKQGKLAILCNISQTHLSLVEKGTKTPSFDLVEKIGLALEIPAPILSFLAFSVEDVKPEKQKAFEQIVPGVKLLIEQFFTED